ncbi:hypothetical protein VOLCADRAFT_100008 [Volvox carteri f. nagariensis]|uniref:Uncharacterized protein n=1 Tax=Volvox carteri f. nagariensis TaxID=3068 RepID=D8UJ64_VOLCA|nr:uncharacterized protein VOLCADRAFT_100008 [Volvox carteri f. nagariensis]EFJ40216.1 hypothetical protein VOLCADRAFT_100008 [Volvox carteri f. nagariensis]|eukprot:XP_002958696.1 hypothetical protein VOLCADRAFT_100008 [Volvox carteri f. nagariensis]
MYAWWRGVARGPAAAEEALRELVVTGHVAGGGGGGPGGDGGAAAADSSAQQDQRPQRPQQHPAEEAALLTLMPDGVLHKRPLRLQPQILTTNAHNRNSNRNHNRNCLQGYDALVAQLAAQHAEYHRVQYRPVTSCGYVLGEFRMQDVGGLAGHPATFRVSRGYCLFKLRVDPESARISRGWVRRQMTQEERDERVWDPVHVYPAAFPLERLHLTRGGKPDPRVMEEAACAWVAAQAKPRRPPETRSVPEGLTRVGGTAGRARMSGGEAERAPAAAAAVAAAVGGEGKEAPGGVVRQMAEAGGAAVGGGGGGGSDAMLYGTGDVLSAAGETQEAPSSASSPQVSGTPPPSVETATMGDGGGGGGGGGLQSLRTGGYIESISSPDQPTSRGGEAGDLFSSIRHGGGGGGGAVPRVDGGPSVSPPGAAGTAEPPEVDQKGVREAYDRVTASAALGPDAVKVNTVDGVSAAAAAAVPTPTTMAQSRLVDRVLADDCRFLDAYGIWPDPDDEDGSSYGIQSYAGRRPQAVAGVQQILRRIQAQQRRCAQVEPLLYDVAVSEDHNLAFVHWVNVVTPAPEAPKPPPPTPQQQKQHSTPNAKYAAVPAAGVPAAAAPTTRGSEGGGDGGSGLAVAASSAAAAAATAATAAARAATAAADVASTAASAASVAASSASTAATIAATAATAAAFAAGAEEAESRLAAASKQQPEGPPSLTATAQTEQALAAPLLTQQQQQPQEQPAGTELNAAQISGVAVNSRQKVAAVDDNGVSGGGGGSGRPMGLQDLRIPMPSMPNMPQLQIQNLEEALTAAAQRVAGAAGTAAAAASAAAAAATAVIMAESAGADSSDVVAAAAAKAVAAAQQRKKDAAAAAAAATAPAPAPPPPPPPVPYQQECMAALLFHDDGTVSDIWMFRGPFHYERRLLKP